MSLPPRLDEAKPSKSPHLRNSSLAPSTSSSHRARSASAGFYLHIPFRRPSWASMSRPPSRGPGSLAGKKSKSTTPALGGEAAGEGSSKASREGSSRQDEGVCRILQKQKLAGLPEEFTVLLEEGGRRVKRSRTELSKLAPSLLAEYEDANPNDPSSSSAHSESSDLIIVSERKKRPARSRPSADDENEEMADGESPSEGDNDGDDGDVSMAEPSSSEDDPDSLDEFIEDDLGGKGHSTRSKGKARARPEGSRQSTRNGGKAKKHYDFGDRKAVEESDEDDELDGSSGSGGRATRATRRSTRASTGSSGSRGQSKQHHNPDDNHGESSDELSMSAKPRKTAPPPKKTSMRAVVVDSDEFEDNEQDELDGSSASSSPRRRSNRGDENWRPQDNHRDICAKCSQEPASELFRKFRNRKGKKAGRPRKRDVLEEDTDAEEDRLKKLGAWVECGVCVSSYHFGCLPAPQKREVTDKLKGEHELLHSPAASSLTPAAGETDTSAPAPPKPTNTNFPKREKYELDVERTFALPKCPACKNQGGRRCYECGLSGRRVTEREVEELGPRYVAKSDKEGSPSLAGRDELEKTESGDAKKDGEDKDKDVASLIAPGLMFRCSKCKRVAHYGCLENDEPEWTFEQHCQSYADWQICSSCYNYNVPLDAILAWKEGDNPVGGDKGDIESDDEAVEQIIGSKRVDEKTKKTYIIPSAKDMRANALYLVKWQEMSYRHLEWVPHAWLAASHSMRLSNFLQTGSKVSFEPVKEDEAEDGEEDKDSDNEKDALAPLPDPNIMDRLPKAWVTVDRVLDVWYRHPKKEDEELRYDDYVRRYDLPEDVEEQLELVTKAKLKWCDLAYRESTDETPPTEGEEGREEYVEAYKAFLVACDPQMSVPHLTKSQRAELDAPRDVKLFRPMTEQPEGVSGGELMDFQLEGINFLKYQWWQKTGCILADEMGLGKTCQIISHLVGLNHIEGARPFLVVVPNSLVGNWMREFARWARSMRVVPYNGDAESRKIVEDYELFDSHGSLKTHVVIATYEALQANARVFRKVDCWDTIVIDEGQRLKSGAGGLLYAAINSLNISHRVLLSGTPLNNNLREVFNLLAFINPSQFPDVKALTQRFAELTPELIEEVRGMLKPYFLRRTKNLVLKLPPLTEVVVPVSMTVLQRKIYRGILERNASVISSMVHGAGAKRGAQKKRGGFSNILMELRKTLCHPYLVDSDIEPRVTDPEQVLRNLNEASAKFLLLERMLPKLQAAGHRVLIFSQFKITLNIVERFLTGLKLKYLRLDGDTPQLERQKDVDKFNAPGSEYFAYLLSTRAGGVGLNITSADVVIIYDQDFNPQMDLQAISRAHRIGQKKPVRVFKLLVKGTCEEKIFNAGNKKLGLEHLIIQRIDAKDETEDVESMLQFGAQAVFDEEAAEAAAIRYTDGDIDDLLKKTAEPSAQESEAAGTFAQAQVWVRDKGGLDDAATLDQPQAEAEQGRKLKDFWSNIVEKQQELERQKKAKQDADIGRGKRTRKQVNYRVGAASPEKKKADKAPGSPTPSIGSGHSFSDEYFQRRDEIESDDEYAEPMDVDDLPLGPDDLRLPPPLARTDGPAPPASKKQRATFYKTDPAYLEALRRKRERREERVHQQILDLLQAARMANEPQAEAFLAQALTDGARGQQTKLILFAKDLIIARTAKLNAPLAPNPAAANQAGPSSDQGYRLAPFASTSTSGPVPVLPDYVSNSPNPAALAAALAVKQQAARRKAEKLARKAQRKAELAAAAAAAAVNGPATGHPPVITPGRDAAPLAKPKALKPTSAVLPAVVASSSSSQPLSASTSAPSKKAVSSSSAPTSSAPLPKKKKTSPPVPQPAAPIAAPPMKKADSNGAHSDSSGGRSTPKMTQSTLSFDKKPSPPTSTAPTSSAAAVPAKRPSPTASSSSGPPAKKPTPPKNSGTTVKASSSQPQPQPPKRRRQS
ncbi:hypothetical protein JCM8547_002265 [Rhodosporidiobolus lusitaniae]